MAHGRHSFWQYAGLVVLVVAVTGMAAYALGRDPTPPSQESANDRPTSSPSASPGGCMPPARVAVLGDSTRDVDGAGSEYVKALRRLMPQTEVRSFAQDAGSLDAYATDPVQKKLDKWAPDAVELSIGINDLGTDQSGERVSEFRAALEAYVDGLQVRFGEVPIVATVPAALSTRDVDGSGYIRPPEAAADVTRELRSAYLELASSRPWLTLVDAQEKVTGTEADTNEQPAFLDDQIHPSAGTAARIAALVAEGVGCPL